MDTFNATVRDTFGAALANAPAAVYVVGTTTLVNPLYEVDGVTVKVQPFTTDDNGQVQCSAANGKYTLRVTTPGGPVDTIFVLTEILYGDDSFSISGLGPYALSHIPNAGRKLLVLDGILQDNAEYTLVGNQLTLVGVTPGLYLVVRFLYTY